MAGINVRILTDSNNLRRNNQGKKTGVIPPVVPLNACQLLGLMRHPMVRTCPPVQLGGVDRCGLAVEGLSFGDLGYDVPRSQPFPDLPHQLGNLPLLYPQQVCYVLLSP